MEEVKSVMIGGVEYVLKGSETRMADTCSECIGIRVSCKNRMPIPARSIGNQFFE